MEESRIVAEIAKVPNWFHRIELAPGIFTPGIQESETLLKNVSLPSDLTGMRVLDIGARDGLFSFESEKRGAKEVIALDYCSPDTTGFNVARNVLGSNVKWITGNVYEIDSLDLGQFDLVLFLGVLYHLRHPYLAIDKIHDVLRTGGQVIVESHIIDGGFVDENANWIKLQDLNGRLSNLNVAQIYSLGQLVGDKTSAWAPSLNTLECMFVNSGFRVTHSWHNHFRGGIVAVSEELDNNHPRFIDSGYWLDLGNAKEILRPESISSFEK